MKHFFQKANLKLPHRGLRFLLLSLPILLLSDCNRVKYSFSGINLNGATTIFIANVFNNAAGGPANIGQNFTETLKDYYQRNSPLKIVNGEADLVLEATITQYDFQPVAIGADQAQQNRLSVTVTVNYTSTKDEEVALKSVPFSFALNYPNNKTITQIEGEGGLKPIIDQIVFDIFNRTLANW